MKPIQKAYKEAKRYIKKYDFYSVSVSEYLITCQGSIKENKTRLEYDGFEFERDDRGMYVSANKEKVYIVLT